MQSALKKSIEKPSKVKEKVPKEELPSSSRKNHDEKPKIHPYTVSTPRNYLQKASATDIYSQSKKKPIPSAKTPKKVPGATSVNKSSPMKDVLKSSPSSVSQISTKTLNDKKLDKTNHKVKKLDENRLASTGTRKGVTPRTAKDLPFVNVTVNSPPARRRLDGSLKNEERRELNKNHDNKEIVRVRQKTRTLKDDEVKVLTPGVDNNAEMVNLARKLQAKPKAFFVDLDDESVKKQVKEPKTPTKLSEDEVSYEDDFESYESDFESYHSEPSNKSDHVLNNNENYDESSDEQSKRDGKDEEKMLDSGSFDLRDGQRSANITKPSKMDFIPEDTETKLEDKKSSLTDEGFQDMSSSSGLSSMRTVAHVDVLDRPLFIDFKKSKENKRKRQINNRLQQRAKDLLSMITLHEMSYALFEMKPIPYDLYMATFGRSNYTQSAIQTFEDGISEEVQTDDIFCCQKWTQFPVEFSKHEMYLTKDEMGKPKNHEDFLQKFTFLLSSDIKVTKSKTNESNEYKNNPLRIYFDQKDGVGSDEMLPYEHYEIKIKNSNYNAKRLQKFLKKIEGRISYVLSANIGNTTHEEIIKTSKLPFSRGYSSLDYKNIEECKFLQQRKVSAIAFSETKSQLLITAHVKMSVEPSMEKCLICLWDLSVATKKPVKILVATENVCLCRYRGSTDGIFVSALEDGSIHLWDLSEEATIVNSGCENKTSGLVDVNAETKGLTQMEIDREWNLKNSNVNCDFQDKHQFLQACAYTSSALCMQDGDGCDSVVGLEIVSNDNITYSQGDGRKVVGQVCSLQRTGILTIWLIMQEKSKDSHRDIGKAYWAKMKLQKHHTINITEHVNLTRYNMDDENSIFDLNAAKKRMFGKKQKTRKMLRPNTSNNSEFELNSPKKPRSAASTKKFRDPVLPESWECGILCTDLKVVQCNRIINYLISKNCGEVLCCMRAAGDVKINRLSVATDKSTITSLTVSPHGLPQFFAATDCGTVHLCSLTESRVLLTLDCRNVSPTKESMDKYQGDPKGRYIGTVAVKPVQFDIMKYELNQMRIKAVLWPRTRPCSVVALTCNGGVCSWDLTHSDIHAVSAMADAICATTSDNLMAILTTDGEVQIHRLQNESNMKPNLELFQKYVALL